MKKNLFQRLPGVILLIMLLIGCENQTTEDYTSHKVITFEEQSSDDKLLEMKHLLSNGSPQEKEEVLNSFMKEYHVGLVSHVISAILDDTSYLRRSDTGWGRVHHQAATAMCNFARRVDGKSQEERGLKKYSFFDDGGVGTPARRREVHKNWIEWWQENANNITR